MRIFINIPQTLHLHDNSSPVGGGNARSQCLVFRHERAEEEDDGALSEENIDVFV